jgi:hypothetical protein
MDALRLATLTVRKAHASNPTPAGSASRLDSATEILVVVATSYDAPSLLAELIKK